MLKRQKRNVVIKQTLKTSKKNEHLEKILSGVKLTLHLGTFKLYETLFWCFSDALLVTLSFVKITVFKTYGL